MTRDEFEAEVPAIDRDNIPLVPPDIYRSKMGDRPEDIPISLAAVLLLKGMGDLGRRLQIIRCFVMVNDELRAALKAHTDWPDMDFEYQVGFAADAIREKLWELLSESNE